MRFVLTARGDASDSGAMAWIGRTACPDDEVHLFFPYRELAVQGSSWEAAVHAADAHRLRVRRAADETVASARDQLRTVGCALGSSIVSADRAELLKDVGLLADTVVLGVPSHMAPAQALAEAHSVSARATVLVPQGFQQTSGSVVVADLSGVIDDHALETAARLARPTAATVLVVRSYFGELIDVDDVVKQTEVLDEGLASWQERAAEHGYSALAAEIVEEPIDQALSRQRGHLAALVVASRPGRDLDDLVAVALGELRVPVILVRDH